MGAGITGQVVLAYLVAGQAALAAMLATVLTRLGGRFLGRLALAAGPIGVLVGWVLLTWRQESWFALIAAPRGWTERLPLVALFAVPVAVLAASSGGRLARWAPWMHAGFATWWIARPIGANGEQWRAWVAAWIGASLLGRLVRDDPVRLAAAGLASWAALMAAGSQAWTAAALVPAASAIALALLPAGKGAAPLQPLCTAVLCAVAVAVLGGGFLARGGGFGGADAALAAPFCGALLLQPAEARLRRWAGRASRPLAFVAAVALSAAIAWFIARIGR